MKNDQKNPIYPSVPFSCMLEKLMTTVQDNSIKWHLNNHMWSLNLNPGFKPTSFNLVQLHQHKSHHIAMSHSCIILSHCIDCVLPCLPVIVPSRQTCTGDVIDDTDEELYYLQKCQASKTPLFIPIQSHSLAPALFYCIRTTSIHLLLAAVAEPLYPLHDLSLPQ